VKTYVVGLAVCATIVTVGSAGLGLRTLAANQAKTATALVDCSAKVVNGKRVINSAATTARCMQYRGFGGNVREYIVYRT